MNIFTKLELCNAIERLKENPDSMYDLTIELGLWPWGYILTKNNDLEETLVGSTFPAMWRAEYSEFKYTEIDPVVDEARRTKDPFVWDRQRYSDTESNRVFFHRAARFGIINGIAVPIHYARTINSPGLHGIFSFATAFSSDDMNQLLHECHELLMEFIHIFAMHLQNPDASWIRKQDFDIMSLPYTSD